MQGHPEIIELLNEVLTAELTAVNQYFGHAKMQENWGYKRPGRALARRVDRRDEARRRAHRAHPLPRGHAQPAAPRPGAARARTRSSSSASTSSSSVRRSTASTAASPWPSSSATTAPASCSSDMLTSEEEHVDWLETQLHLVDRLGEQLYLSEQLSS